MDLAPRAVATTSRAHHGKIKSIQRNNVLTHGTSGPKRSKGRAIWHRVLKIFSAFFVAIVGFIGIVYWNEQRLPSIADKSREDTESTDETKKIEALPAEGSGSAGTAADTQLSFSGWYVSERNEHNTQVFRVAASGELKEKIFEFVPNSTANFTQSDMLRDVYHSAALSPDTKRVVYITEEGLFMRSLDSGEVVSLITQTEKSSLQFRMSAQWSVDAMTDVYALSYPAWSANGRYVSFLELQLDSVSCAVFDTLQGEYFPLRGDGLECYDMRWAPSGDRLVISEVTRENTYRFRVVGPDFTNPGEDIAESWASEKKRFMHDVAFHPNAEVIAFLYKNNLNSDDDVVAYARIDGSDFRDMDEKKAKSAAFFSQDGKRMYYIEIDDQELPRMYFTEWEQVKSNKTKVVDLPEGFVRWDRFEWLDKRYIFAIGKTFHSEKRVSDSRVFVIDVEKGSIAYESKLLGENAFPLKPVR